MESLESKQLNDQLFDMDLYLKRLLINLICTLGIPLTLFISVQDFLGGKYITGGLILFVPIFCFSFLVIKKKLKDQERISVLNNIFLNATTGIIFIALVFEISIIGNFDDTQWSYIFPLVVFSAFGWKRGLIWIILFFVALLFPAIFFDTLEESRHITQELWIRFSSYGAAAGQYEGCLNVTPADGPAQKLPVTIKVWKTEMPAENIVRCVGYAGGIGFLNGLTGDPAKDEPFKKRLDAYFANMEETRIDVLEIYSPLTIWNQAKIGGQPMQDVLKDDPSILKREPLPEIDLSYYDSFFEIPKKHGLRHDVVIVGPIYARMLSWLGGVLGEEMTLETPHGRKYAVWLAGAWQKYLRKQGFKNIWAKIDDEIPPEGIPSYNKNCDLFRLAGARPYTTWTGTIFQTPDLIRKVNRNAEQWQLQFLSLDIFRNLVNEQPSLIDPTDEIWFYAGGGGPYRFSYLHVRLYGFLSGYYNMEGFGWWTYCWWHKNEMIAFRKDGTVYSTPALEGLRDAIEDAQLYVMLNRKTAGGDDKRSWTPTKFSYGLVGRQSGLVPLVEKSYAGFWNYYSIGATSLDAVLKGKARLLEMLEE